MGDFAGLVGVEKDPRITVVLNEHDYEFYIRAGAGYDICRLLSILQGLCLIGYAVIPEDEHPEEVLPDGTIRIWLCPIEDYADPMAVPLMAAAALAA